jgi:WD40 repeat protein
MHEIERIPLGLGGIQSIAVTGYGYAACGTETGFAPVVNLVQNTIVGKPAFNHRLPLRALAFSRDARRLVCASNDGHISVVNPGGKSQAPQTYEQFFSAHASWVTGVVFHPSGSDHIMTVSRDKAIRAWKLGVSSKEDVRKGHLRKQWTGSTVPIWSVAYSTNGAFFATGDAAYTVNVYRQKDPPEPNGADPP